MELYTDGTVNVLKIQTLIACPKGIDIAVCSIVKLIPFDALGNSFDYTTNRHEIHVTV